MASNSLVSIIVPTRNSADTLEACLESIRAQSYPDIEVIVVDRDSTDDTKAIAKRFTNHVLNHGPERSAQRNLGACESTGKYVLFIDSDMVLDPSVVVGCVAQFVSKPMLAAANIPETSFGQGFWAKCKALERSYYVGVDWMESPRFMPRARFHQTGGYNESIAGGEDWELTQRLQRLGPIGRIDAPIRHDEGRVSLRNLIKKRRYYAQGFSQVYTSRRSSPARDALRMYGLFFSKPQTALRHPVIWPSMLFMKTTELTASGLGYVLSPKQPSLSTNQPEPAAIGFDPMPTKPLVSVIVTTRNNAGTIGTCLESIKTQTYQPTELIVVDRDSSDATKNISRRYTAKVFNHGPERSAQRNFAATQATGQYLLIIDSDMELAPSIVAECVALITKNPKLAAINIPETSFGSGFWAKCKALERTYYNGVDWIECPRFMSKATFHQSGGYNEHVAGGEDWELTQRLSKFGPIGRVQASIRHDEGRVSLRDLIKKRLRLYGEGWAVKGGPNHYADGPRLLALYFSRPLVIAAHPLTWLGMMYMRTLEMCARAVGYHCSRSKSKPKSLKAHL